MKQNMPYPRISSWPQFARHVRSKEENLLKELHRFPNSILVTGCQRSGTTMVSRIITKSEGMMNYWFGKDDELDAALILSGAEEHAPQGRYCFQTTYLNDRYHEYFTLDHSHRVVWILRNPYSVVYSLMYNWGRFAFNELFRLCGSDFLDWEERCRYDRFGRIGVSKIKRACLSYNGKVSQLNEVMGAVSKERIIVLEYDELVNNKESQLPKLYDFIGIKYKPEYVEFIHTKSMSKARQLSRREKEVVQKLCIPVYEEAKKYISIQQ